MDEAAHYTSSRNSDGHVPNVNWNGGALNLNWNHPQNANANLRARAIVSAKGAIMLLLFCAYQHTCSIHRPFWIFHRVVVQVRNRPFVGYDLIHRAGAPIA